MANNALTNKVLNRAFITGAGGFVGKHLVDRLTEQGTKITALLPPTEAAPSSWGSNVTVVRGDIRQLSALADSIDDFEVLIHLAALMTDWGPKKLHTEVTIGGTEQAIALALKKNAHMLVTSSGVVYASRLGSGLLTEDLKPGKPCSHYERCKQQQEKRVLTAVRKKGLNATILRPGNVYGIGSDVWVHRALKLLRAKSPVLLGSADWDAGLCHVYNLVDGILAAAETPSASGEIFNIADGFGITLKRYLEDLAKLADTPPPVGIPNRVARHAAWILELGGKLVGKKEPPALTVLVYRLAGGPNEFCINKAQQQLGYSPAFSYEQAIAELSKHFGNS